MARMRAKVVRRHERGPLAAHAVQHFPAVHDEPRVGGGGDGLSNAVRVERPRPAVAPERRRAVAAPVEFEHDGAVAPPVEREPEDQVEHRRAVRVARPAAADHLPRLIVLVDDAVAVGHGRRRVAAFGGAALPGAGRFRFAVRVLEIAFAHHHAEQQVLERLRVLD